MSERESARHPEIAEHFRRLIVTGAMGPGERLPSMAAIAEQFTVSPATANKAIKTLVDEKLVISNSAGTRVAPPVYSITPAGRATRSLNQKQPLRYEEIARITFAGMASAPGYVTGMFGLEEGTQVGRREAVYTYRGEVEELIVSWHPPRIVEACPELIISEPIRIGTLALVVQRLGHEGIIGGSEFQRARGADEREAELLGLQVGAPVLAVVGDRRDGTGVLEYVECVYPPHKVTEYHWTWSGPGLGY